VHRLKFYKSSWNFNSTKATYKEWFVFFEFLNPSTLGGHNFLNSIQSLYDISASNLSTGGIQVLFGHQKQVLFGSSLPPMLKCLVTDWFTLVRIFHGKNGPYLPDF